MREKELENLLNQCEGEAGECKPKLLQRHEIAEYAVGIGNAGGGYLIMGVSNRSPRKILPVQIPTQDDLARMRESVADSAQIHLTIEVVPTEKGAVIIATIPARLRGILFHSRDGNCFMNMTSAPRQSCF
jgi:predicted HTH transcriptional regulator